MNKDLAASVRARLLNIAKAQGADLADQGIAVHVGHHDVGQYGVEVVATQ